MLDTQALEAPAEPITIDPDYSIKGLVSAVIIQAARDAARGDPDAVAWLKWDGLMWAEAAGFDAEEIISRWIAAGCKAPERGGRQPAQAAPRKNRARKPSTPRSRRKPYQMTPSKRRT